MTRDEQEHLWELAQDPPAEDIGVVVARFSVLVANAEFASGMRRAVELAEQHLYYCQGWDEFDAAIKEELK